MKKSRGETKSGKEKRRRLRKRKMEKEKIEGENATEMQEREDSFDYQMKLNGKLKSANQIVTHGKVNKKQWKKSPCKTL